MSTIESRPGMAANEAALAAHTARRTPPGRAAGRPDPVAAARKWLGRSFHGREQAQCANFVRAVFGEAGIQLPCAVRPSDAALLPPNAANGPSFANSFAGDEIGPKVAYGSHQPGDIVMYANTYGSYRPGVITHVGIVSSQSKVIHRPTAGMPVSEDPIQSMRIAEIRRPKALTGSTHAPMKSIKIFQHGGKGAAVKNGAPTGLITLQISCAGGVVKVKIDGKWIRPENLALQIFY
jgi:hypothetical protein